MLCLHNAFDGWKDFKEKPESSFHPCLSQLHEEKQYSQGKLWSKTAEEWVPEGPTADGMSWHKVHLQSTVLYLHCHFPRLPLTIKIKRQDNSRQEGKKYFQTEIIHLENTGSLCRIQIVHNSIDIEIQHQMKSLKQMMSQKKANTGLLINQFLFKNMIQI